MSKKNIYKTQYIPNSNKINLLELILYFVIGIIVLRLVIFNIFYITAEVNGESMLPTLNSQHYTENGREYNDYVLVSRFANFSNGDIVVTDGDKLGNSVDLIKRIIAMPGDELECKLIGEEWVFFLNGEELITEYGFYPLTNSYIKARSTYQKVTINGITYERHPFNFFREAQYDAFIDKDNDGLKETFVIPNGKVFLLGDNRTNSTDCKIFGAVSIDCIQGVVVEIFPAGTTHLEFVLKTLFF